MSLMSIVLSTVKMWWYILSWSYLYIQKNWLFVELLVIRFSKSLMLKTLKQYEIKLKPTYQVDIKWENRYNRFSPKNSKLSQREEWYRMDIQEAAWFWLGLCYPRNHCTELNFPSPMSGMHGTNIVKSLKSTCFFHKESNGASLWIIIPQHK